jgi:probable addiction module antidote protein
MARTETQLKEKLRLYRWDVVDHLDSDEAIAGYLDAVLDENDPALLTAALGDVARAKGMTQVSRETGLGRESLYKALSLQGNPEFATVQKVLQSLGLKLHVSAK